MGASAPPIAAFAEPVPARRLISWLSHANLLLEDVDKEPYGAVTASLGRSWRTLRSPTPPRLPAPPGVEALAFATFALAGHHRQIKDIETNLASELAWQMLGDGGHVSRHPAVLVELLLDLLPFSHLHRA